MSDKKDVAGKLESRVKQLLSEIASSEQSSDFNARPELTGLQALRGIFNRQVEAQLKAHKIDASLVTKPPEGGNIMSWDHPWMRQITMWLDAMHNEIEETRDWLPWKSWKKSVSITDNDIANARMELIDVLHFWLNAYAMLGGSSEMIVAEYHAKRDENDDRQKRGY